MPYFHSPGATAFIPISSGSTNVGYVRSRSFSSSSRSARSSSYGRQRATAGRRQEVTRAGRRGVGSEEV